MATIELSGGSTYYELSEGKGKTVVLVHGGTVPCWSYDHVYENLSNEYRILRYDQYGRGRSAAPEGPYIPYLYLKQLQDLLDALEIEKVDTIVGSSFGAVISVLAMVDQPPRFDDLILLSPAVNWVNNNPAAKLLSVPYLGPFVFDKIAKKKFIKRAYAFFDTLPEDFQKHYSGLFTEQIENPDFWRVLFSQITSGSLGDFRPFYERLSRYRDLNPKIMWGELDTEVPRKDIEFIRNLFPNTVFKSMPNCTHGMIPEDPEAVTNFIAENLK